jgi:anti-sigma regulatory factor (Ser/Thr protein kinase)
VGKINHLDFLISADEIEIFRVTDDIEEIVREQGFPDGAIREVSTALREVLKIIIRHGCRGKKNEIAISCTGSPLKVTTEILYSAPPKNPLAEPDYAGKNETLTPEGVSLLFVKQAIDIVTYRYEKHRNIVTLVKVRRG